MTETDSIGSLEDIDIDQELNQLDNEAPEITDEIKQELQTVAFNWIKIDDKVKKVKELVAKFIKQRTFYEIKLMTLMNEYDLDDIRYEDNILRYKSEIRRSKVDIIKEEKQKQRKLKEKKDTRQEQKNIRSKDTRKSKK